MTARKNQTQAIIFKIVLFIGPCVCIGPFRRTQLRFEISRELVLRRIKSCPSTQSINGFESGGRNQPWPRVAGYSTPRPQAQRSSKGFVHRLLGKIKITEQADQSGQDSSRIHAIKGVEQFAYLLMYLLGGTLGHDTFGHDMLRHDNDLSKPAAPNQSESRATRKLTQHPSLDLGTSADLPENCPCLRRRVGSFADGTAHDDIAGSGGDGFCGGGHAGLICVAAAGGGGSRGGSVVRM